jgi:hypothetical protein
MTVLTSSQHTPSADLSGTCSPDSLLSRALPHSTVRLLSLVDLLITIGVRFNLAFCFDITLIYSVTVQLAYQLADSMAGFGWSFAITTLILWCMHYIPGLRLRCSEDIEIIGVDDGEMGEFAYD